MSACRFLMTWLGVSIAASLLAATPSTFTQDPGPTHPDSASLLDDARVAQRRFERIRRDHLPFTHGSSGRCDLRIGRYCFTFDDHAPAWVPPPEDARVILERDKLIGLLDSIAVLLPADSWITMQRVRYLVEAGHVSRALHSLKNCTAVPLWLCDALRGYALHLLERYVDAEEAFTQSLVRMDEDQRCEWEDLSEILDGDLRGEYRDLECRERGDLQRSILILADPLYQIPGNELWTEHLSRHVVSVMNEHARGVDGERWNRDDHRILLRYGWPTGWERHRDPPATALRVPLTTHYGTDGSKFFLPSEDFVMNFPNIDTEEWDLEPRLPQSNHNPAYARSTFAQLTDDLALFKSGDSALVVTSFVLEDDSITESHQLNASLGLLFDLRSTPRLVHDRVRGPTGTLWAIASPVPHLMSVEVIATDARRAARSRRGVDLGRLHRAGLVASDLLVLEPLDIAPRTVHDAIPSIRAPAPYTPGDTLLIYWELYGLVERSDIRTTLSLQKTSKGIFRRIAELTPFASAETALSLAWSDVALPRDGKVARAVTVALPVQASDGQYLLTLSTEVGNQRATLEKTVEIRND